MNGFMERSTKSIGLAGAVVTISDLMQPIAPVAAYVAFVSFISIFLFWLAKLIKKEWQESLSVCIFFSVGLLVISSGAYFLQGSSNDAKDNGFLAANSSILGEFQADLGLVNKSLKDIALAIDKNTEVAKESKKETSSDPMKELANKGFSWKNSDFLEALNNKQYEIVELYASGGMKVRSEELPVYLDSLHDDENSRILLKHKSFIVGGECPDVARSAAFYKRHAVDSQKARILMEGCGAERLKIELKRAFTEIEEHTANAVEFNAHRDDIISRCVQKLENLPLDYFNDKYFKQYSGFDPIATDDPAEENVARELYTDLMVYSGEKYINENSYIADLAKEKCALVNAEKPIEHARLNELKSIEAALF